MTIKIIDGKRYNTETALQVWHHDSGGSVSDFRHFEETLYVTDKGAWFTCGSGGPMSPYARTIGQNQWSGSRDVIRAITADEARAWLETHDADEIVMLHFADQIVDA